MRPTLIHLVRHGAVHNPDNIRYGRAPGYRLSELGREQARRAARHLGRRAAGPVEIVASPLERARETAELIAEPFGLPLRIDGRLIEAHSAFDGLPRDAPATPGQWEKLTNPFRPSWGEPFSEVAGRMTGAVYDLVRRHRGRQVVVVSHQSPIWLCRLRLQGWTLAPWLRGPVRCHHASISSLWFEGMRFVTWWYWRP